MDEDVAAKYERAASKALDAFGVTPSSLRLHALAENVTFQVTDASDGGLYALRLHRPGYHTLSELESEKVWTTMLANAGVSVPTARSTSAGEFLVLIDAGNGLESRYAGLAEWVPGQPLSQWMKAQPTAATQQSMMQILGRMLARLHTISSQWRAPAGFQRPHLDREALLGPRPHWGPFWDHPVLSAAERELVLAARTKLLHRLADLDKSAETYGMVHADLHSDNVIADGSSLAIIDFDDAAYGWYHYDIAATLEDYDFLPNFPELRSMLLSAYRSERDFGPDDEQLLDSFILVRELAHLGWYGQRPEVHAKHLASLHPRILERCEKLV